MYKNPLTGFPGDPASKSYEIKFEQKILKEISKTRLLVVQPGKIELESTSEGKN